MGFNKRAIYEKSPSGIKKIYDYIRGSLPFSIRLGKEYTNTLKMLEKEDGKSGEEHDAYQFEQLKKVLIHAYENVPYYNQLFQEVNFDPYGMSSVSDIEIIPFLTKDLIEENFEKLLATNIDKKNVGYNSTSGTSGHQLQFAYDKRTYFSREWAYIHYLWKRIGYVYKKSTMAALRNEILPDGKLCEFDLRNRRWVFDSYHLTPDNIEKIVAIMDEKKIEFIHTYPSAIYILAKYMLLHNITMKNYPSAVIVTSEMLFEGQKEVIESAFKTKVFTFYGHSERAALASWCEYSTLYHIQSEYGYVELIDDNNAVISKTDIQGEIVCTGFNNYVMPLIRYRTADYSSYSDKHCECGRQYKILNNISGRWKQDALVGKEGNLITDTALNMHSMIFANVEKFQFVQEEQGKCTLLIVKGSNYTAEDEEAIIAEVNKKIADSIDMHISYVNDIERTAAGKYRYIVRKFDI